MKKLRTLGKVGIILLIFTVMLGVCACGTTKNTDKISDDTQSANAAAEEDKFQGEFIVDTQYVSDHIDDENVLFVDARGWKQAVTGTVKGAIATTWQDLSTCDTGSAGDERWGKIPEADDFAERLSKLGISKDKEIILIAQTLNGWGDDARILWQLRAAGFTDVKMVDGGYDKIKADGVKTQLFASDAKEADVEIDKIDNTHVMTTEELQKNYSNYKIIDVRTKEEYDGAVLYNEKKGGHLPGAIFVPYTDLFKEDGTLKSNDEITKMFEAVGIQKDDKVVSYCTGGIRSAYTQLVLEMCGYKNTYSYDQSFWRWCVVGEVE